MENQITQRLTQLTELPRSISSTSTVPTQDIQKIEVPADKNILAAFSTKKIIDCSPRELDVHLLSAVTNAFKFIGKRENDTFSGELKYIYDNLPNELKKFVPAMRAGEIPIAIKRGLVKEFGDYFGINVAELLRFCKAHYESEARVNAAKQILKPAEKPNQRPTLEQEFIMYKNNLLDAFEKNKVGGRFEVAGPGLYDFCNKLGLIIFSTKEKYEILEQAGLKVMADQHLKLATTVEDYARRPLKRIVECVLASMNEEKPLPDDVKGMVIAKSKFLTLKAFFLDVETNEFDLSELVDNKKDLFFL